jgi:hypothetical protein
VDTIWGVSSVLKIKLVLVIHEFHLLLARCTLSEVLSFIAGLILSSRWADPIDFPYFLTHLVVIEVAWPLNILSFVLRKELLVSAHNCFWVFESDLIFRIWVYALCAINALVGSWAHFIIFHNIILGVNGFAEWGSYWLIKFLLWEVAGILTLYIWRYSIMSGLSWRSRCSINCCEIHPGSNLRGLEHGSFTLTLLNAIELINILWRLSERTIANLTFHQSVDSWW